MSSWKKMTKSRAKSYRERSQPAARAHLGMLEKKKDYKDRSSEHHKKQEVIKTLKRKALDRNPDEFYFNMVNTHKKEGVHEKKESEEPEHTDTQIKMMYSQDQRYVNMKRTSELRKIERLKSSLHVIDSEAKPQNKHIVFVDSKKEVRDFDEAKYFNTHPSLVSRTYNRPTLDTLRSGELTALSQEEELQKMAEERRKKYKMLKKRIEREKELKIISDKMEMRKHLMDKKAKKQKIKDETKAAPAQYKWSFERKR